MDAAAAEDCVEVLEVELLRPRDRSRGRSQSTGVGKGKESDAGFVGVADKSTNGSGFRIGVMKAVLVGEEEEKEEEEKAEEEEGGVSTKLLGKRFGRKSAILKCYLSLV